MKAQSLWRRVQASTSSLFILQLFVALFVALAFLGLRPMPWLFALPICSLYALIITIAIKRQRSRYIHELGLSSDQQLKDLANALRYNSIPTDKETLRAFPVYLASRSDIAERSRKNLLISMASYACILPISITGHDWFPSIVFGVMLVPTVYSIYALKKTQNKIAALEVTLTDANIQPDSSTAQRAGIRKQTGMRMRATISIVSAVFFLSLRILMPLASANGVAQQSHPFTSAKDNFTINFPGNPSAVDLTATTDSGKSAVPYTIYESYINEGYENYTVEAIPYPQETADFASMPQPELRAFLFKSVSRELQNSNGKLVSTKDENIFSGHTAAEEIQFTRLQNGHTYTGYYRVFTVGNVQYGIIAQNSSKAAFEHFANSYQFTGQNEVSNYANERVKFGSINQTTDTVNVLSQPSGQRPQSGTVSSAPDNVPSSGTFSSAPTGVPTNGSVSNAPSGQGTLIMVDPLSVNDDRHQ
jgi:hypothetical protein